jgi:hypothetical protein
MTPQPDAALRAMMGTLMMEIAPHLPDDYRKASTSLLAFALMVISIELDRAADVAISDNREMRELFATGADVVEDQMLRQRLREAALSSEPDMRVSTLTAATDDLRRLLIELHVALEEQASAAARDLCAGIWRFLRDSAQRRAIHI